MIFLAASLSPLFGCILLWVLGRVQSRVYLNLLFASPWDAKRWNRSRVFRQSVFIFLPILRFVLYLRLKPNHLTLIGLAFFGLASALILQKSSPSWIIAAWLIALGGSLDFFDGWVARVTKHASEQGAVFDSLVDRLSEGILFCSFFWILSSDIARWILLLAFWGSMMTSYLRSIGERLGVAMCQGVLQRPGRFGILAIGLWLAGVFSFFPHASLWLGFNASHVLQGAFILIAMLSWITVLQRSLIIFRDFNDSVDSQPLKK